MSSGPAIRLRKVRITAGYPSARSAAQALGVAVATYTQHENGAREFTAAQQDTYLAFFRNHPADGDLKPTTDDQEAPDG